jgi:hypothetical protein
MSGRGPDDELLPGQTRDDTDVGWGDAVDDEDDVGRFLDERPPHHDRE